MRAIDPKTWTRICELFDRVADLSADAQAEILNRECGLEDTELRQHVERMLSADSNASSVSDEPLARIRPEALQAVEELARGQHVGGYEILEVIAEGGMATVYRARQSEPERSVALKISRGNLVSEEHLARFRYETQILGRLNHPGIAQIFETGTHWRKVGGDWVPQPFFALEFIEGAEDLVRYCRRCDLDLGGRLEIFVEACAALSFAHQSGVLHRDLKPGNILVNPQGRVKVIDFGIARPTEPEDRAGDWTRSGDLLGTLAYMSPEQREGKSLTVASDVFALGCVLHELVEDRRPFQVKTGSLREIMESLEQATLRPFEKAPRELGWILQRALEGDRERRYPSVEALADDLRRFREGLPLRAGPPSRIYVARKFVGRHRLALIAIAAVLLSLGVGLARSEMLRREATANAERAQLESHRWRSVHDFFFGMLHGATGPDARLIDALESGRKRLQHEFDGQPLLKATAQSMLAKAYLDLGKLAEARQLLEPARQAIQQATPGDPIWLQVQLDWMYLLLHDGQLEAGLALCDELLPWASREDLYEPRVHANLWGRMGSMYFLMHRYEEAAEHYIQAVAAFRKAGATDDRLFWQALQSLGGCYLQLQDHERALECLEEVQERTQNIPAGDRFFASLYDDLGQAYLGSGWPDEAVDALREALRLAETSTGRRSHNYVGTLNNLASALLELERFHEAEDCLEQCVQLAAEVRGTAIQRSLAQQSGLAAKLNQARMLRLRGDPQGALMAVEELLQGGSRNTPKWLTTELQQERTRCLTALDAQ